jgi:hypothetical protein
LHRVAVDRSKIIERINWDFSERFIVKYAFASHLINPLLQYPQVPHGVRQGAEQHQAAPYLPDVTADALRRAAVPALRQSSRLAFLNIEKSVRILAHGISRLAACPVIRPPAGSVG